VLERNLDAPHGLVVVTGPTGSGKTTTLASALARLNAPVRKILTIEDPIEYDIPGINQSQAKPSADSLRVRAARISCARTRCDHVVRSGMGNGKDRHSSVTHWPSCTHGRCTPTRSGAVTRLVDMGVEPFLLASTLRCIVGPTIGPGAMLRCRRTSVIEASTLQRQPRYAALGIEVGDQVGEPVAANAAAARDIAVAGRVRSTRSDRSNPAAYQQHGGRCRN